MAMQLMGKKEGMTQSFDDKGNVVACTLIHVEPHVVVSIKNQEKDGYDAIQLGWEKVATKDPRTVTKRMSHPLLGLYRKLGIEPRKYLVEAKIEDTSSYVVGQEVNLSSFLEITHVDVTGCSKGKGYQGVIKRHNFAGGRASHGSSFHRHGGSCGMRSTPGRTLPGQKKAGRMGGDTVTLQNLKVLAVDIEKNLLIVEGAIPGPYGSKVSFSKALKKKSEKKGKKK